MKNEMKENRGGGEEGMERKSEKEAGERERKESIQASLLFLDHLQDMNPQNLMAMDPVLSQVPLDHLRTTVYITYMVKLVMNAASGICIWNSTSWSSEALLSILQETVVKA